MSDFIITSDIVVTCPHCGQFILIVAINCQIFRHASYKLNGEQIPPHTARAECEALVDSGSIFGCGRPFRIVKDETNSFVAIVCEYI